MESKERTKELKEQRNQIFDNYQALVSRVRQISKSDFFGSHPIEESWPILDNLVNQCRQLRTQLTAIDLEIEYLSFEDPENFL